MSTLKLYKTDLAISKNAKVDSIADYLGGLTAKVDVDIQYQQLNLDMDIKIVMNQSAQAVNTNVGNYADLLQDGKHYYFFIMSASWISKDALKLVLSMDTVNTFANDFTFTDKTNVIREHRDRFNNISVLLPFTSETLESKVDKVDEGINGAVQYKKSSTQITDTRASGKSNQLWYLVYSSTLEPSANNAIDISLVPHTSIPLQPAAASFSIPLSFLQEGNYYYFMREDNPGIIWRGEALADNVLGYLAYNNSGNVYDAYIAIDSGGQVRLTATPGSGTITAQNVNRCRVGSVKTCDTQAIAAFSPQTITHDSNLMSKSIANVDRTLSSIVKIIELPYAPFEVTYSAGTLQLPYGWWIGGDKSIRIPSNNNVGLGQTFTQSFSLDMFKTVVTSGTPELMNRFIEDTKLMNSNYYTYKLTYDSYSLNIPFEQLSNSTHNNPSFTLDYHQAETLTSNLGFKVNLSSGVTWNSTTDYPNYLLANRNNETPIYTNAYLDYLRNGYNYDKKAKDRSIATTWIQAGVAIVGTVVSIAAAIPTGGLSLVAAVGFAGSAITTTSNAISNTINSEQAFQAKQEQLKAQAATVNSSDDIDLLNWYNGNKAAIVKYSISDELKELVDDLFYYCGYATNVQKLPNTTSRYWFNFIQCEAVFDEEQSTTYSKYLDDLKARYRTGVTVYHKHGGLYDFDQVKENWEVGFIA